MLKTNIHYTAEQGTTLSKLFYEI